jgi:hypothetical protein
MKRRIGIIAVTLFLADMLVIAAGCNKPATYTTLPITTSYDGLNSASSESANDLSLSLSLDSTTYHSGQSISIDIDEKNALSKTNNVPVSDKWPRVGLTLGPCGTTNYPFGISIFRGYYSTTDISTATPLQLYNPGAIYNCPMILSEITYYNFQPSSDIADIFGSCALNPCLTVEMNSEVNETGYWTGNSPTATLNNFTPGVYTVVGGDEWGTLVILHFTVSP